MSDAGAAPVISEVAGDALPALDTGTLTGAMTAFEHERVGIGLGGAAAGAVLGTLIAPGVGTAIGAFVGVFAGFLKGIDSLKADCIAKLGACLDDGHKQLSQQVAERQPGFAAALRGSLEDGLDISLSRFERSITRLVDTERATLHSEGEKIARLAELNAALDAHEAAMAQPSKRLA
jgi:hypothetical protein